MDKPVTPAEEFRDALSSLVLSLDNLREALEILACEIMVAWEGRAVHGEESSNIAGIESALRVSDANRQV